MNRIACTTLAIALVASLGSANAHAAPAAQHARYARHHHPSAHAPALAYRPAQAGMVIAWDPESHTFTMPGPIPTLPLTAAERNALSRSFAGLVQVHHPDGSVSVDLQGRFQEFAVVHLGPDGKPVYRCLDDTAAVRRALHEPTTASGLEER
jgi:hypothetical protein